MIVINRDQILTGNVLNKFVDNTLIALKNKFLTETSQLKKAGLIFLLAKIFFTDSVGFKLKLRVNAEEWKTFKDFLNAVKSNDIRLMIYHLFTENFFRFALKSRQLALDFGAPENIREFEIIDSSHSRTFWKEVSDELTRIEHTDLVELKQLAEIRDEALKPFEHLLPEKVSIEDAINNFMVIKECVETASTESPQKASRREVIQSCKDFINQPGASSSQLKSILVDVSDLSESDCNKPLTSARRKHVIKRSPRKKKNQRKEANKEVEEESETSENEFKKMTQRIGFTTQNILQGIGTFGSCSDKLKKAYE